MKDKIKLNSLVIKSFRISKVLFEAETKIEEDILYLRNNIEISALEKENIIENLKINIIYPDNHDIFINSVLDIFPIDTKVEGKIGEGITNVLTGVIVMITGVEVGGFQAANIGSSEGILKEQIKFNKNGTPTEDDIIIHVDVTLKNGGARSRDGIMASHRACDKIIQEIREYLKNMSDTLCDETHEYMDRVNPERKKIVIIKQVSGLGCMYDTGVFPKEPAGFIGCKSIMDLGNMPMVLTPNQYRDGAIRAMS
ncbi:proline reductase cluster protein PrdD [Clostridium botulinum]|uniref:proline reductase cluster protein PrdD n=1 Tax=Clostridium botulinum TaxID=1491 RepID=UPI0001D1954F|nr:proline reductase cluster protein PrdD [Clostridium botulinum]ADG01284.1 glycine/sarcosine/betaine reductase, component B, subunits alpha and beta [Clostridium botulinum F str. 230613]KKM43917.1 proline reductase [Clostridium botulinum]MBY6794228.1 proline reductase cluster protein PrdD [Clostridium botulinum]MBY6939247.1 proline reductase cluster protein PrdD [Clostridium botulinum]MBY6946395.1 proline reductase cluster protein PrdD [Clostridium botulinum]